MKIQITVPSIVINQFDEERFIRIEQLLTEVLQGNQQQIDALTTELKTDVDAQQAATDADKQPNNP